MALDSGKKIGDWTQEKLDKFITAKLRNATSEILPKSLVCPSITAQRTLVVRGRIELSREALQYIKDNLPP